MDIKESEPAHSTSAMEINNMTTMTSNDYLNTLFDTMPFQFDNNSNKGFVEMLGLRDFPVAGNSFSDLFPPPMIGSASMRVVGDQSSEAEVIDKTPANSISNSASSSSDADVTAGINGEEEVEHPNIPEEDNKSNKQLKVVKRKNEKKKKEAKVAFMTKSEVDHLDDGYRWRKYGQKAVKNSPFPRSYYRCTTTACGVKKRVERSCEDRTIVVTTYEGQHSHPCPLVTRGGAVGLNLSFLNQCSSTTSAYVSGVASFMHPHHNHYNQQRTLFPSYFINNPTCPPFSFNNSAYIMSSTPAQSNINEGNPNMVMQNMLRAPCLVSMQEQEVRDNGLLQDIVPSQVRNKITTLKELKNE